MSQKPGSKLRKMTVIDDETTAESLSNISTRPVTGNSIDPPTSQMVVEKLNNASDRKPVMKKKKTRPGVVALREIKKY